MVFEGGNDSKSSSASREKLQRRIDEGCHCDNLVAHRNGNNGNVGHVSVLKHGVTADVYRHVSQFSIQSKSEENKVA
jgi:hypothetical protein